MFNPGDLVRRIKYDHKNAKVGVIYAVKSCGGINDLMLENDDAIYCCDSFELVSRPTFAKGDKIRRIGVTWGGCKQGEVYVFDSFTPVGNVKLENDKRAYDWHAFELVEEAAPASVPSAMPFPYPETDEDRERKAREQLREYKRGMRDLLYGTNQGE